MGGNPTGMGNNVEPIPSERERKEAESAMAWEIWDALLRGDAPPQRFITWSQQADWKKWK